MPRTTDDILDELLILQSQDGDTRALQDLLLRWHQRLLDRIHTLTGRTDAAHDILQHTLLAIARGLHGLHDPAAFPAWAMRIAAFKTRDWLRAQKRARRRERPLADADLDRHPGGPGAPPPGAAHDHADAAPGRAQVRLALDSLPAHQRAILILHYAHDIPIDALATSLEVPPGTVKSRLFHARRALRRVLESHTTLGRNDR